MKKVVLIFFLWILCDPMMAQDSDTTSGTWYFSLREREEVDLEEYLGSIDVAPLPQMNGSAADVSLSQALAVLRKLTKDSLPRDIPAQPANLRSAAAMSLGSSLGMSQALLLEAERIKPGEPQTRISMAGLLIVQGYPREAMALLGQTPPSESLKLNGQRSIAAAWNLAKGMAFLVLREARQAVPLLEKAIAQDGSLTEASRTLAKAKLMQGKREEAMEVLRNGAWRQRGHGRWSRDGKRGVMPYHKLYKLNNGKSRSLQVIEPPLRAKDLLTFTRSWETRQQEIANKSMEATAALMEASAKMVSEITLPAATQQKGYMTGASKFAMADAVAPLSNMMGISPLNTQWDPVARASFSYLSLKNDYADDIEAIALHDLALSSKQQAMITQMLIYMDVIPAMNETITKELMQMKLPDDEEQRCRKLIAYAEGKLPTIFNNILPLDDATRDWYRTAWKISSAIAAHVPYGPEFKQTEATLESMTWQAEMFRLSNWMVAYSMLPSLEGCEAYMEPVPPKPAKTEEEQRLQACNDFTSGISFKFKIPKPGGGTLLEMGLSCEKMSLKGDIWNSGVLSAKLGVEYAPSKGKNGELTGLVGVAADLPGGFGVEVDGYLTYDVASGDCNDWGVKTSAESNVMVDPVPGVKTDMETVFNFEQGATIVQVKNGQVKGNDAIIYVATGLAM